MPTTTRPVRRFAALVASVVSCAREAPPAPALSAPPTLATPGEITTVVDAGVEPAPAPKTEWPIFACPPEPPADGARCENGLECTYGGDARLHCRARHVCLEEKFLTVAPRCEPIREPLAACPFRLPRERAVGPACARTDALCSERGTICACGQCRSDNCLIGNTAPKNWICANPSSEGCPRDMPDLGAACERSSPSCVWGAVAWSASYFGPPRILSCRNGRWQERHVEPGP